jgi:hypothetical protein
MKVWVCCETRNGNRPHYTGYALLVDVESGEVLARYTPPEVFDASMPADGIGRDSMGVRQVIRMGDEWWVGTNAGVVVLDDNLNEVRRITNNYYAGGHALVRQPGTNEVWFNSTPADSLVRMDRNGTCTERLHVASVGAPSRPIEKRNYRAIEENQADNEKSRGKLDTLHINSIQFHGDAMYATSCTTRTFLQIRPDARVILHDRWLSSPHDFTIVGDRIVVNDSGNSAVVIYRGNGQREHTLRPARAGWTRGLAVLDAEHVLIGTTPLGILKINITTGNIESHTTFADAVQDSCHGLSLVKE